MQARTQLANNGIDCGKVSSWEAEEVQESHKGADEWQLLLQIGCDDDLDLLPSGDGCLYVLMKKSDLRNKAFERAWVVYQCS